MMLDYKFKVKRELRDTPIYMSNNSFIAFSRNSILGSVFIVAGLYVVLWGKSKETKKPPEQQPPTESQEPELEELVVASDNKTKNKEANQVTRGAHNK